ncbi:hypothetical protein [Cellulosimicrobium sp. NPDC057127]|uniref:hypothetical protein n=1 Tax=Cellulosimicrobium sp. NPDC057127 TaxID=3346026 RepID=UPI00363B0993
MIPPEQSRTHWIAWLGLLLGGAGLVVDVLTDGSTWRWYAGLAAGLGIGAWIDHRIARRRATPHPSEPIEASSVDD